jgi:hypothetical protein
VPKEEAPKEEPVDQDQESELFSNLFEIADDTKDTGKKKKHDYELSSSDSDSELYLPPKRSLTVVEAMYAQQYEGPKAEPAKPATPAKPAELSAEEKKLDEKKKVLK